MGPSRPLTLRFTRPALADLAAILSYIDRHSPEAAGRVKARLKTIVDLLTVHPQMGRATDDPTIRRMTTLPYPYLVFYEVTADAVIVHAVRHAARDPASMPGSG